MKSPNLNRIHLRLKKQIALVKAYTEIDQLDFIIKACRLKPYDYIFGDKTNSIILYDWWFDEFGNSFKIEKKKIKIIYNDLFLDRDNIIKTDLYYGLSLDKIVKMSKLAYLCLGKDEDLFQEYLFLTFLGIDSYLRSYIYIFDEWHPISPLYLGINNLIKIARQKDFLFFKKLSNKKNIPFACFEGEQWITYLPADKKLISYLNKQSDINFSFLTKE